MPKPAITVTKVSKSFRLPHEKHQGIKQTLINFQPHKSYATQHVLKGLSFEIQEGEFFGIVGRNGSGKSTLLKILAQTYTPDIGHVTVNGSLTPFIELGVGFNPELTGRENVYLNAALLGFSHQETDAMYDGIVEFAELGNFMDQKLKNYSSGMQLRLAFSIAIRAESDILLLDEVLAVGDEAFQRKCLDVFEKYKATKQTVILVTHDMKTVRDFCTRAMLINDGEIVEIGSPRSVADKYSQLNQIAIDQEVALGNEKRNASLHLKARLLGADGQPRTGFALGDKLTVDLSWKGIEAKRIESVGVNIFKLSGEHLTGINTRFSPHDEDWRERGTMAIEFELGVTPGKYYVLVEVFEEPGKVLESMADGLQFTVAPTDITWSGLVELPFRWIEHPEDAAK